MEGAVLIQIKTAVLLDAFRCASRRPSRGAKMSAITGNLASISLAIFERVKFRDREAAAKMATHPLRQVLAGVW